jgi:hypothetical protein
MKKLDSFRRLIVLKCIRPDKITNGMQDFVAENIGQRFIEPQVRKRINSILEFFLIQIFI